MLYSLQILIGRSVKGLDHPFTYLCKEENVKKGMRVLVPFGASKETVGFILEDPVKLDISKEEYESLLGHKVSYILRILDPMPLLNEYTLQLAKEISNYYKTDLVKVIQTMLPPSLKPKDSALKYQEDRTIDYIFINKEVDESSLNTKELSLYSKVKKETKIKKSEISAKKTLQCLLDKKILKIEKVKVTQLTNYVLEKLNDYSLTAQQQKVYDKVIESDKEKFILQGVTGSGKTEVYIRLAKHYLKMGKGVLILMPEIALADRMTNLFYTNFKDTLSILYSSLTPKRKKEEFEKIITGQCKVVLGTRSAVFAPIDNLGLIIVDEEHSTSYKNDNMPTYDALKVCEVRNEIEHCKILFASATIRLIDKAKADRGIFETLTMDEKIHKSTNVEKILIDMSDLRNIDLKKSTLISVPLIKMIDDTLSKKQQVMLLLNRRGYSTLYLCEKCHKPLCCPSCGIPLVYHQKQDELLCHHCGYTKSKFDATCSCGSRDFKLLGYGTEKVFSELETIFPNAKIFMLDSDIASNNIRRDRLESFSKGDADILIGTQVISKGMDFKNVTLAAILDTDFALSIPSYSASEDTFFLISQFIGRTGRSDLPSTAVIQTHFVNNAIINLGINQDYDSFYKYEMEQRRKYKFPPFVYKTTITIKGIDQKKVTYQAQLIKNFIFNFVQGKRFDVIGPTTPYIYKMNGYYLKTINLKYKVVDECMILLDKIKDLPILNEDVNLIFDIDSKD